MSDGSIIEARLATGRTRAVCLWTGVEAKAVARRFPRCTVGEAVARQAAWEAEADRRMFVRKLWAHACAGKS